MITNCILVLLYIVIAFIFICFTAVCLSYMVDPGMTSIPLTLYKELVKRTIFDRDTRIYQKIYNLIDYTRMLNKASINVLKCALKEMLR